VPGSQISGPPTGMRILVTVAGGVGIVEPLCSEWLVDSSLEPRRLCVRKLKCVGYGMPSPMKAHGSG